MRTHVCSSFVAKTLALTLATSVSAQQTPTAPPAEAPAPAPAAAVIQQQPHTLVDGTPIKLRLAETISSHDAKVGQEIPFEVVDEVKVDDVVVYAKGATAIANVTEAEPKKTMGRAGKLNMSITYGRLVDGEKVALRAIKDSKGGGHVGAMTAGIVATSIVFFPAAPLLLFVHGKDVTIPKGTEITAFIDGDMHLDMTKFGVPAGGAAAAAAAPAMASLVVESTPAGADIEVDGTFAGNTPSTLSVTPGVYTIRITRKGFQPWERKMNVAGGNAHVAAELEQATGN